MSSASAVGGFFVLTTAVVAAVLLSKSGEDCSSDEQGNRQATSLTRLPENPPTDEVCRKHDGKSALVIPLRADNNGIFLVDIGVESDDGRPTQWIKAAVDTGSESLLVATDECKGCEEGKHLGTVRNEGKIIKRGKIRYGSQQDTVVWRSKKIKIPAWLHTCDPEDHDGAHTDRVHCIVGDCPCAFVESRTGTSDYNILGLGSQSSRGPPATLNALFPEPPRAFKIEVISLQEAKLIIHRPVGEDCRKPRHQFAVIDKAGGYGHHYLVRGSNPPFTNSTDGGRQRRGGHQQQNIHGTLRYGRNAISLPPDIYTAMEKASHKAVPFRLMPSRFAWIIIFGRLIIKSSKERRKTFSLSASPFCKITRWVS